MLDIPPINVLFQRLAVALALGFLIGIERESEKGGTFAGVRTFPLISLLGCLSAMLTVHLSSWFLPVAFMVIAALLVASYRVTATAESPGITTEVTVLLSFCYGVLVWMDMAVPAAALAVLTMLLLASKGPLQRLSRRIGHHDLIAAVQFGVITVIVLPILPNREFGPLHVLNPYKVWLMVVLIAALNLVGYVLIKILGSRQGLGLAGFFGGLASSTALTLSFSRRSRSEPLYAPILAFGILLASSIMFLRVLILVFVVAPSLGRLLVYPMAAASAAGLAGCLVLWTIQRRKSAGEGAQHEMETRNPCELWSAINFGLLFGAILFVSKGALEWIGTTGIFLSAGIAGLADVDAITLSLCDLTEGTLSLEAAARGITIAAIANTLVKAALTVGIGTAALPRYTLPAFGVVVAAGAAAAFVCL